MSPPCFDIVSLAVVLHARHYISQAAVGHTHRLSEEAETLLDTVLAPPCYGHGTAPSKHFTGGRHDCRQ